MTEIRAGQGLPQARVESVKRTSGLQRAGKSFMRAVVRATRTFFSLALPYFRSEDRWIAGALLTAILVVELGLVAILVAINEWNKRFFNALESRDWNAAQFELIVFCGIALAAVVAGMAQFFLGQRLIIRWRRWITDRYV
jgi:putative ATP-binding cassette transporter